jgi:hypothetical protein
VARVPRFCARCGGALRSHSVFCAACGARIAAPTTAQILPGEPGPGLPDRPPGGTAPLGAPVSTTSTEGPLDQRSARHLGGLGSVAKPPGPGQRRSGPQHRSPQRGHAILVGAVVGAALLAAGGGAYYGLVLARHPAPALPVHAPHTTAATTSAPGTPTSTVSTTSTPSTTLPPGSVDIGAISKDPEASVIAGVLDRYFRSIDDKNWNEAYATFSPSLQRSFGSPAPLASADATTTDSRIKVLSAAHNTDGSLDVGVDFRSHQAAAYGPVPGQTCTDWTLSYRLVPTGAGLAIDHVSSVGSGRGACPAG